MATYLSHMRILRDCNTKWLSQWTRSARFVTVAPTSRLHPLTPRRMPALSATCTALPQVVMSDIVPPTSLHVRLYAKGKSKPHKQDKKGKPKVVLDGEELNQVINFEKMTEQMTAVVDSLVQQYVQQLTLRSSAGSMDQLQVETKDGKFPLIQLGQIANKNPQMVAINLAACPQYIGDVKNAIINSGMNLNPQQDGTSLFVPIPKVTREHRENLAKNAKTLCEKAKEKIKDVQNKFIRDTKKHKGEHSKDLVHNIQETILSTSHEYNEKLQKIMDVKQKELLGK